MSLTDRLGIYSGTSMDGCLEIKTDRSELVCSRLFLVRGFKEMKKGFAPTEINKNDQQVSCKMYVILSI
jgi:hypothetical protein